MVTPKGNADKLPDEWKDEVVAIIKKYKIAESESVHLYQEVVKLLDRCVTEAVLMNTAELLDALEISPEKVHNILLNTAD